MKKSWIYAILIIFIIIGGMGYMIFQKPSFNLKVGDENVDEDLFKALMENNVARISNEYYQNYGMKIDEGFWQKEIDGQTPLAKLKQLTIDELKTMQATYLYAKKLGVDNQGGVDGFMDRLNNINQERQEAIANNEVIYGLKEYSVDFYATYEIDRIKEACYKLINIEDSEAKEYYHKHQDLYVQEDKFKLQVLEIYYGVDEELFNQYENIKADLEDIYTKVINGASFKDNINKYQSYYREINPQDIDLNRDGILLDYVKDLKSNEISEVIDVNGCFYLIYVVEREAGGIKSYDDALMDIIYQLKKDKVEAEINLIKAKLTVSDESGLDSFMLSCLK